MTHRHLGSQPFVLRFCANVVPTVTVAEALQGLVESIQVIEESVVPRKPKALMDSLSRVRRAR